MTQTVSAVAALITPFIGRGVVATDKLGAETVYTITKLSDKIGTLKDGSKGEYVVLQKQGDSAVVLTLHPQHAKRLVTKGEDSGLVLAMDIPAFQPTADVTPAPAPSTPAPAAAPAPVEAKEPSKKEKFAEIYATVAADVKTAKGDPKTVRQLVKTAAAGLQLSEPGFNTYFQNMKSGKWA